MTLLRQRMLDALVLRGMARRTQESYIEAVARLRCRHRCEPLSGAEARGSKSACADLDGLKGRRSATPGPARPIPIPWTSTIRATKGKPEFARCRSDL